MTIKKFIYYDHYSFRTMFLKINRMMIDGESYLIEIFEDADTWDNSFDHIGESLIKGIFYSTVSEESRLDTWYMDNKDTKIVVDEIKDIEFIQIKP